MARGSAPLDGGVLPPSHITSDKLLGLPRWFMPARAGQAAVIMGEACPAPLYPAKSVFFLSFAMVGLFSLFSSFFYDVLEYYGIRKHTSPTTP